MSPELKPGIRYRLQYTVPDDKTVPHLYPEFVEFREMPAVFATGFMIGLIEGACQLAIKPKNPSQRPQRPALQRKAGGC